ncbi:expansin EXLX1 family cellulose-binding protein [Cystobacter ferrugineus]|uniref:Expansin-like EG45 domain-containing protein n=1 Tax=Cystobacter ferrugineus TaxID=83449 RepID=A0A1L9BAX5_9BACT|nr:expansin EXLX1 family cellulose-binding protein [Cystobacter ferrugineus]OJH39343.1 hypothetical protein BON30_17670 [Cystobacter ferrugineus]
MHTERLVPGRWLAAPLLFLLAGCGDTSSGGPLLPLGDYQSGLITFYDATGAGNCSFDASPNDLDVAAINIGQYRNSAMCGACAEVEGPLGTLRVRIVDSCPDCPTSGHLDLSRSAFAKIANPVDGRVPVRWRLVTCNTPGPLRYHFKDGSNPWWTAIQVRNHLLPVVKLEAWKNGAWVSLPRESYNYFVDAKGLGSGEIKVRVTSMDGQTQEDILPGVSAGKTVDGKAQFRAP